MQGRFLRENEVKEWIGEMSNTDVIRNIDVMSALIDNDGFCDCMLLDEIIGLLGLLHEECAARIRKLAEDEKE